ncbi:MAG TPA: squalene--hopene cyclase [Polyangiaceae bacterium]|nr:squalene--hopene cyclase [Polyangiaceae bacterium]
MSPAVSTQVRDEVVAATLRARGHLLGLQDKGGFWRGELETNVTMDAEDLLLRAFLGISDDALTQRSARWIRSRQRTDGAWDNAHLGPPDLSTTVEAYVALRLAGDPIEQKHMRRAAAFIRAHGGLPATRVFTRIWLALFGLWSWDDLPTLPPELMLLPPSAPLSAYSFASWARQTIVALSVVMTVRPQRSLGIDLLELSSDRAELGCEGLGCEGLGCEGLGCDPAPPTLAGRAFAVIDAAARWYLRAPVHPGRERALLAAEQFIVSRQEADGSWGGIQPPWVYSIIALSLRGYPLSHPVMRAGIEGLSRFTIDDGETRRMEACQSPVWDTALAVLALVDAGCDPGDSALVQASDWLLTQQVDQRGDWSVRRPALRSGGWAFEFENVNYPDVDDTAEVMLALRAAGSSNPQETETALARGATWVLGMQSDGGGFGAFDADNTNRLVRHIPFCDFGEVIDEPSADVTAHAVEMLVAEGFKAHPKTRAAVRWLVDHQEADGSWFGRWGVNYVYGIGAVLPALVAAGLEDRRPIDRAVAWLESHQNADGGFGEGVCSYGDKAMRGVGPSTPSQTAWAMLALLAADSGDTALARAADYLVGCQRSDGGWDEDAFTGTGFPGDFYIRYHLYRDIFPTMALGRYARALGWRPRARSGRVVLPQVSAAAESRAAEAAE